MHPNGFVRLRVSSDLRLRKQLYTPSWRRPGRKMESTVSKSILALLTVLAIAFLLIPPPGGYAVPVSFQLAAGDLWAWTSMSFMVLILAYLSVRLWKHGERFAALSCLTAIAGLVVIARTNPLSTRHLDAFAMLVLFFSTWLWGLYLFLQDGKLLATAIGATVGMAITPMLVGIGERIIAICTALTLNFVFYDYMVE